MDSVDGRFDDSDPLRPDSSFDAGMKQYSKKTAAQVSGAIADLADEDLPWKKMVGVVAKPKPHQASDPNWRALRNAVETHARNGRPERLTPDDFTPVKRLGHGDVGSVHLVALRGGSGTSGTSTAADGTAASSTSSSTTGTAAGTAATDPKPLFAMKVLSKQEMRDRNKLHRVKTEGTILESLDHPFCATLYAAFQTETHLYFVMQFCEGGELYETLQGAPGKRFAEKVGKFYAAEVLCALQYLHLMGFIYRDLKPENVLLRKDGHVVVTDFDLSYCASSRAHVVMLDERGRDVGAPRTGSGSDRAENAGSRDTGSVPTGEFHDISATTTPNPPKDTLAAPSQEKNRDGFNGGRVSVDQPPGSFGKGGRCASPSLVGRGFSMSTGIRVPGSGGGGGQNTGYPRIVAEPFAFTNR